MPGSEEIVKLFTVTIEDEPTLAAVDTIIQAVEKLGASTDEALQAVSDAFDRGLLTIDEFAQAWVRVGDFADQGAKQVVDAVQTMGQSAEESAQRITSAEESVQASFKGTANELSILTAMFDSAEIDFAGLQQAGYDAERLSQAYQILIKTASSAAAALSLIDQVESSVADKTTSLISNVDQVTQALAAQTSATESDNVGFAALGDLLSAIQEQLAAFGQSIYDTVVTQDDASVAANALGYALRGIGVDADVADNAMTALDTVIVAAGDAMTFVGAAINGVSAAFGAISGVIDRVSSAFGGMTEEATAADEELRQKGEDSQMATFGLLILATTLYSVAQGFVAMGEAAQQQLAYVQGLALGSSDSVNNYIGTLEQYAVTYGVTLDKVAQGFYYVISSGIPAAQATLVLNAAMMAASGSGAALTAVSSALTSVLRSYALGGDQAMRVTDQMTEAVRLGKQTYAEFASAIGIAAVTGAALHLSFDQVAAAESTMTQEGFTAHRAVMDLDFMLRALLTSTDNEAKTASGLGLAFNKTAYNSDDLIHKLLYLQEISKGNQADFIKLVGGANGFLAAQALLTNQGQNYIEVLKAIDQSSGATADAFQTAEQTMSAASDHLQGALSDLAYQFVVLITPIVAPALTEVAQAIAYVATNADLAIPIFVALGALVGGLLIVAGGELIGMLLGMVGAFLPVILLLAPLAAGVAALVMHWDAFVTAAQHLFPELFATQTYLEQIGGYLGGVFNQAVGTAGDLLGQLANWIQNSLLPALDALGHYLIQNANITLSQVVPALVSLANWIQGTLVPALIAAGTWMQNTLIPAFIAVANWVQNSLVPALVAAANWIQHTLVPALVSLYNGVQPIGAFIMGTVVPALVAFGIWIGQAATWVAQHFVPALNALHPVLTFLASLFSQLGPFLAGVFVPAWQQIQGIIAAQLPIWQKFIDTMRPLVPTLLMIGEFLLIAVGTILAVVGGIIVGLITGILKAVGYLLVGVALIVAGVINIVMGFIAVVAGLLAFFVDLFTGHFERLSGDVVAIVNGLAQMLAGLLQIIAGLFYGVFGAIFGFIAGFCQGIYAFFAALYHALVGGSIVPDMVNAILAWFTTLGSRGLTLITTLVNSIITTFGSLPGKAVQWGVDMIHNFITGINSQLGNLGSTIANVASTIASHLHFTKPDIGPLADADQWMPDFITLLIQGLEGNLGRLSQASIKVAGTLSVPSQALTPSTPATPSSGNGQAILAVLTQILAVLQSQRSGGQTGSGVPPSVTLNNVFAGGNTNMSQLYSQLDQISGIRMEAGLRGGF